MGAWSHAKKIGAGLLMVVGVIGFMLLFGGIGRHSGGQSAPTLLPVTTTPFVSARLFTPALRMAADDPFAAGRMFPDSEVIYGESALDFDIAAYIAAADGALQEYTQYLPDLKVVGGSVVVEHVAEENSINPRLLLALLEYENGVVFGSAAGRTRWLNQYDCQRDDLYGQLVCGVRDLAEGYYGRRQEGWQELRMPDGRTWTLPDDWSAGQVALAYYFASQDSTLTTWDSLQARIQEFLVFHRQLYGAWPAVSAGTEMEPQPDLTLPFTIGETWFFTDGPHAAWEKSAPEGALDFAPPAADVGCDPSPCWALAAAAGRVTRARDGVIALDLDDDGYEQTGWVLVYAHVSDIQTAVGEWVEHDQPLGHPSCEGGPANGRHIHVVRKFNGEWVSADGAVPFVLSGWRARSGAEPKGGTLVRGIQVVTATNYGAGVSKIIRDW